MTDIHERTKQAASELARHGKGPISSFDPDFLDFSIHDQGVVKGQDYTFHDEDGVPVATSSAEAMLVWNEQTGELDALPVEEDEDGRCVVSIRDAKRGQIFPGRVRSALGRGRKRRTIK